MSAAQRPLSEEQAAWLRRVLESRGPQAGFLEKPAMPGDVLDALVERGLVRWWTQGAVEITLEGIIEVAQRRVA